MFEYIILGICAVVLVSMLVYLALDYHEYKQSNARMQQYHRNQELFLAELNAKQDNLTRICTECRKNGNYKTNACLLDHYT